MKELWNKLNMQKRYALLTKAYPARSWELHNLEAKLKWDKLLPSTQKELEKLTRQIQKQNEKRSRSLWKTSTNRWGYLFSLWDDKLS